MAKNFFKSILKPNESVAISLGTAGLTYGVYQFSLPSLTEIHGAMPHNNSVDSSRKKAMWTAAAVVGGATLLTRDPNVFTAGMLVFLALEWSTRHANAVHPESGKMVPKTSVQALEDGYAASPDESSDYAPDYGF